MTITFQAIVATDEVGAIGRGNAIPWRASADMKRFKRLTLGCPVIMGYRTAKSIGMALPGRYNIVLSTQHDTAPFPGQALVRAVAQARELAIHHIETHESCWEREEAFIIGGGQIYKAFMPFYDGLHLTTVHTRIPDADAFFPVDTFLNRYASTRQLRLCSGGDRQIQDGDYKTTYAHYTILSSFDAARSDLAHTDQSLPWCGRPTAA